MIAVLFHACQDDPILPDSADGDSDNIVKTRAFITQVQLNSFPPLDPNGELWDAIDSSTFDYFGLPDISFNITDPSPGGAVLWNQASHFANIPSDSIVYYILTQPHEVIPIESFINVNIYDFDLTDSLLMGTVNFYIGESQVSPRYPTVLTESQNGYSVSIGLRWEE